MPTGALGQSAQEDDDNLSVFVLNIFPNVNNQPGLLTINLVKVDI